MNNIPNTNILYLCAELFYHSVGNVHAPVSLEWVSIT